MLETRLDNVVYRLGFAGSRAQARQLVRHGHFQVNGRRVNIPSYGVRPSDVVSLKQGSPVEQLVRDATDLTASVAPWLQADHDGLTGTVLKWPERDEIDAPVQESLIVGSPEDCIRYLENVQRLGITHILFRPAMREQRHVLQTIRLLGTDVIPHFAHA